MGNVAWIELTSDLVKAYVSRNRVSLSGLPELIRSVHSALTALPGQSAVAPDVQPPAVSIKKSVTPDYLICLEDGRQLKSLKRHLRVTFGMTPGQYRAKWRLPADYPMVAPNYSAARSKIAKSTGLGRDRA